MTTNRYVCRCGRKFDLSATATFVPPLTADKLVSGSVTGDKLVSGAFTADHEGVHAVADDYTKGLDKMIARLHEDKDKDYTKDLGEKIARLHEDKGKAYAGSWCKRGERLSIIPNIVRKADRLGVSGAGDSSADTYIDLLVYLVKYDTWLKYGEDRAEDPDYIGRELAYSVGIVGPWTPASSEAVKAWTLNLKRGIDRIIDEYDETTADSRSAQVSRLVIIAAAAARLAAQQEGWTY